MSKRLALIVLAVVLIVGTVVLIRYLRRPRLTDRQQIERLILEAQRTVEAQDLRGLMRLISPDYNDGSFTKRDLQRLGLEALRRTEQYNVLPRIRTVQIQGEDAFVAVDMDFWIGEDASNPEHLPLKLNLHKTRGKWLIVNARGWERASGEVEDTQGL